ncbi:MAG: serine hydrolase domain-containing protein [bacterium]
MRLIQLLCASGFAAIAMSVHAASKEPVNVLHQANSSPVATSCKPSSASKNSRELAANVLAHINTAMERHGLNSTLVRITIGRKEVLTAALGESQPGVPATTSMHFHNGAVAISYLSTLLLQLADRGEIDLDEPIATWLPDFPAADKVTPRMLASSSSGYPDYVPNESFETAQYNDPFRQWTPAELLEFGFSEPLWYEPGTNWNYAHTNFVALGLLLEAVTGKPVDKLIRNRILDPLEMNNTASFDSPHIPQPVLHSYTTEREVLEDSTYWNPSWQLARGAIMTTNICDLARSAKAIGKGKLISKEAYQELIAPDLVGVSGPTETCPASVCRPNSANAYYGLGIIVLNGWILQNPAFGGFSGVQAYYPDQKIAVAIAATGGPESDPGANYANLIFADLAPILVQ